LDYFLRFYRIFEPYGVIYVKTYQQAVKYGFFEKILFYTFFLLTMRKITQKTANAFANYQTCKIGNSYVDYGINGHMYYYLHDNLIGDFDQKNKKLTIMDAGRESNTTKERLNGILDAFGIKA
jgi:hypothetical protein